MLALVIALLAAFLPRHFEKLDRHARAERARPLLGDALSAARTRTLEVAQRAVDAPGEVNLIDLSNIIANFEKVIWQDLSDRDHTIWMFAYREAQQAVFDKEKIESHIEDGKSIEPLVRVLLARHDLLNGLHMTFMSGK